MKFYIQEFHKGGKYMPFIYKITNKINQKSYIGKTIFTVDKRWKEHCRDSRKKRAEKRSLYNAMNKYGIENFEIEIIEECSEDLLEEKEKYWINVFDTYHNGYNATLGGDGKLFIDRNLVIDAYSKYRNITKVASILNISTSSVKNILKLYDVQIDTLYPNCRPIKVYDKDGTHIENFDSAAEASRWLISQGVTKCKESGLRSHILEVCNGKRKTVSNYVFSFA